MKYKITVILLTIGLIIYTFTIGTKSISNIFLILIYVYLLAIVRHYHKKSNQQIKSPKNLLDIINNIPIPAFLKDTDNTIIAANNEFFNLMNIKNTSNYKEINKLINLKFDKAKIIDEEKEIYKSGKTLIVEKDISNNNFEKYQIYKVPIFNNNKELKNIAVFIKKVENRNINKENNQNIIATLTHDLKTPAVAQIRAIELLLKGNFGEINETQRTFLNDILNSCNNMLEMLINMLWLYKFDNKRIAVNASSFDVNELIKEIFNENKLILNSNGHTYKLNNETAKIHILADKMHIKRIIFNLLTNAISHSKENSPIYIDLDVQNNNFIFKVTSQGEHIPDELLKCIFDKNKIFNQKCDGLSTGLGLYLSNSLLELNGGKFIYNSEQNGMNTFGFTLKLYNQQTELKANSITITNT